MDNFTTKYNYLVFGLRLIMFLFLLGTLCGFIFYVMPKLAKEPEISIKIIIGSFAGLFLTIFLPYRFGKAILTQRNILTLNDDALVVNDALWKKEYVIEKSRIKGFSVSTYPTRFWDFKEIIVYFHNGDKMELPQFLYWNFKDISPTFTANNLVFLGNERFRWKFFDSRYYQFD